MIRRADMDREGSAPSSLLNSAASNADASTPAATIAAEAAAMIAKSFPGRRPAPATIVIFGAAGDLTKRLVVPALYNLVRGGKLPEGFALIGIDRNDETTEAWRGNLTSMIQAFARASGGERHAVDRSEARRGGQESAYTGRREGGRD